jgi:surface polysaccharide O-acyltransferase-like enzyme
MLKQNGYERIELNKPDEEGYSIGEENIKPVNQLVDKKVEINIINNDEDKIYNRIDDNNDKDKPVTVSNIKQSKRKRLYWVDALRVLATYMVITIHCSDMDHKKKMVFFSGEWKSFYFYYCILKPCVPLFIMISGLLFLDPNKNVTLTSLYRKSIPRLLKAYFFWATYYSTFDKLLVNKDHRQFTIDGQFFYSVVEDMILARTGNQLWYIKYCIGIYMFIPIFREVIPHKALTWYTAGISCICFQLIPTICEFLRVFTPLDRVASIIKTFLDNLRLYPFTGCIAYLMFGYLLNVNVLTKQRHIIYFYIIGILGFILTPVLMMTACYVNGKYGRNFGDYMNFNVCMYTVGMFMFFKYSVDRYLKKLIKRNRFKKALIALSDCSFGIYLLHYNIYRILLRIDFHPHSVGFPILFIPFYSFLIFSISFVCIYFMRKIKILKEIN